MDDGLEELEDGGRELDKGDELVLGGCTDVTTVDIDIVEEWFPTEAAEVIGDKEKDAGGGVSSGIGEH